MKTQDLNKSIDTLIDELFAEPIVKSDNLDVASASKTTADAAIASAPGMQDDASRGAGRPKQISDVPSKDEDGKRDGQFDGSITEVQSEVEPDEAKKQAKAPTQISSEGRIGGDQAKMKDPRLTKSLSDEEYAEFEAFKKSKAEQAEKAKFEELKKAEDLKKAELENLVKSAVAAAIEPLKRENQDLKKSLTESETLIKAMAGQPQRSKSVTGIDAIEKSLNPEAAGPREFTKSEKLDAAESLVKSGKLPVDAVIELENTGTIYNRGYQQLIEAELQKQK